MKTVIQVYKIGYINADSTAYHGIGDFIRSTLGIYYLSKIHNFNLIVDFSLHPIQKYIEYTEHIFSDYIKEQNNNIHFIAHEYDIMSFINNSPNEAVILSGYIGLEAYYNPITQDAQLFIQNLLKPNKKMQEYIDSKLQEIPFPRYNILHYRLGDNELVRGIKNHYNVNHIMNHNEKNDILISDSITFKELVKKSDSNIFMFESNICHMGFHKDSNMQDTVFEFFPASKAEKIKSYSIYDWASGFTRIVSFIYNIPIEYNTNIIL